MNGSSNVLVLGVTGQVGKRVATNLKRKKATLSVGSRTKTRLKELADQFGASRFIDLDDPRTFDEALNNVTSIFLITGYTVDMLVQSKSLIDAAKRNGVTHIVHLGAFTREHDSYATVFAWHQMIEAYLRDSGIAWTNLHPNMFMQNFLSVWSIKGGLYSAYTSKAIGFTALEDVAEAAAVILMEGPEKHSGMDYWFSVEALTTHLGKCHTPSRIHWIEREMQSFDFSPRAAFIRKIEDEPNRDLVFHSSAVELSRGSKIEHPCLACESEFPSLANLVVVFAPLCRLLEIALPLRFRLSTDCGWRYFGRDSTVVIHSSGLKSVTTDNQKKGL